MIQIESHFAGEFSADHFFGGSPNVGFDAAATDGAGDGTIFAHQHAGAFIAGDRPIRVDDGREGSATARLPHAYDFLEQVHARLLVRESISPRFSDLPGLGPLGPSGT